MSRFFYPLWQLIDNAKPSRQSINQVLSNLPANYVNLLFREDAYGNLVRKKNISRKAVEKLCDSIDIHALTCWIAFCLEAPEPRNPELDINQLLALKYLIKIGLTTPFSAIVEVFHFYLNEQFWPHYINCSFHSVHFFSLYIAPNGTRGFIPMRLISEKTLDIRSALSLYQELCERAIQINLVPNSKEGQVSFYNFICHTEIQTLINILYQADNHPTSLHDLKRWIIKCSYGQH
jgi:hypothetical protein